MKFIKNLLPFMGMGALLLTASALLKTYPNSPWQAKALPLR